MGDIGKESETIIFEPLTVPAPIEAPAEVPVEAPAKEPVPA